MENKSTNPTPNSSSLHIQTLSGLIKTFPVAPTHVPRKFDEQFVIYNGQLYYYDTSIPGWKATLITPITELDLSLSDVTTNNVTSTKHGFAPKSPANATQFLNGDSTPAFAAVKDSDLSTSDIATNNASTSKHGFLKKLSNTATEFMDGQGNWDTVKDSDLSTSDITTNDVSTSKHGFVPKAPNDTTKFLRGDGTWGTVTGGIGYVLRQTANGSFAPADATTYYVSSTRLATLPTTSGGSTRLYIPKAGTIKAAYGTINVAGTLSSGEDSTVAIRLNDTTNTNISTTVETNATNNAFSNSSLSINVAAGDFIDILLITPTWTTNPTSVDMAVSIYIE